MLNFRQDPEKMLKRLAKQPQLEMYKTVLLNLINSEHERASWLKDQLENYWKQLNLKRKFQNIHLKSLH